MKAVEKVLFLTTVDLFKHLPGEQIERIASIAEEADFNAGERVIREGDPGDFLALITKGKVKVHKGEKDLAQLSEGACVGEMAILDDLPRSADVTAITAVTCLRIDRDNFDPLLESNPGISRSIMRVLTERLRVASQR